MSNVTQILFAIEAGDRHAADELLPIIYDDLRKLAAAQMAREAPSQTLQPTALVHEAYVRLVGPANRPRWRDHAHFFAAAAEAMRRILVDAARRRQSAKRGGEHNRKARKTVLQVGGQVELFANSSYEELLFAPAELVVIGLISLRQPLVRADKAAG